MSTPNQPADDAPDLCAGYETGRLPPALSALRAKFRGEGRAQGLQAALDLLHEVRWGVNAYELLPILPDTAAYVFAHGRLNELEALLRQALAAAPIYGVREKRPKGLW